MSRRYSTTHCADTARAEDESVARSVRIRDRWANMGVSSEGNYRMVLPSAAKGSGIGTVGGLTRGLATVKSPARLFQYSDWVI